MDFYPEVPWKGRPPEPNERQTMKLTYGNGPFTGYCECGKPCTFNRDIQKWECVDCRLVRKYPTTKEVRA